MLEDSFIQIHPVQYFYYIGQLSYKFRINFESNLLHHILEELEIFTLRVIFSIC